jgi:hypothetical protein
MRLPFLLLAVFIASINPCQAQYKSKLSLPAASNEIPFTWVGDSLHGGWDPYTYLLIPVRLPGCPKEFYMQFDLGSPYSMFYTNKLAAIGEKYPKAVQAPDSTNRFRDLNFTAGKTTVDVKEMVAKQYGQTGINWNKTVEVIGTIGSDLILGKVLIIDYPGKQLYICDKVPEKFAGEKYEQLIWAGRGVLLPATIRGKKTMLFFDTGSSAFELITEQETSQALAIPGSAAIRYPVNSWGQTLTANTFPSGDSIEIVSSKLPLKRVTYMEGVDEAVANQMKSTGMGGMTGNKLFLQSILILDLSNKKVGLAKP